MLKHIIAAMLVLALTVGVGHSLVQVWLDADALGRNILTFVYVIALALGAIIVLLTRLR